MPLDPIIGPREDPPSGRDHALVFAGMVIRSRHAHEDVGMPPGIREIREVVVSGNRRTLAATLRSLIVATLATAGGARGADRPVAVDLSGYRADCGVTARQADGRVDLSWRIERGETGHLAVDLRDGHPLIERMAIGRGGPSKESTLIEGVDPVTFVTVGQRVATPGRPPGMSPFNEFFDAPATRPHTSHRSRLEIKHARLESQGKRASLAIGDLTIGPFTGELVLTVYPGSRLVHVEAVVATFETERAFLYDAGLAAGSPSWTRLAWKDPEGLHRREAYDPQAHDRALKVRHRTLVAESPGGSLACFPPPHSYFSPRDSSDNLGTTWSGKGHRGLDDRGGFGIRQSETGGGSFAPWFNAPPGTRQRLGVFYLLSLGDAAEALRETLRYTHGDRFVPLDGHRTLTSHWHMEIAMAALQAKEMAGGREPTEKPAPPDFVAMFKDLGVNIVHLAEFHGQGHSLDPGPLRLPELESMFRECRRLSDDQLLLLPGEEANVHIGRGARGEHPGHWLYLFPRPVYWTMRRAPGRPFSEDLPRFGKVYHVGDARDMSRLIAEEHGLAWTAHPRIKASSWSPDLYRDEDYYKADSWLGGAWKAMPADLSRSRLGERALDLLDDMANWGGPKYLLGEVDVFKIDHTHELYGHMNINYVRLDRQPRYDDDWSPILDAIRRGRFLVTTGEVLIRDFRLGGKRSGETASVGGKDEGELHLELDWTFPLRHLELISGDGERVYRDRVDLSETPPFGTLTVARSLRLRGRTWVRAEAWDVAGNGAFTQPIWLTK